MLASLGTMPELARQLSGLGGCTNPVRLDGHRTEYAVHRTTGEIGRVLNHLDSSSLPREVSSSAATTVVPPAARPVRRFTAETPST